MLIGSPPLWRNRDYMLLWGGQAVSVAGSHVSGIAFPILVLALTHSPVQAGIVGFCGTLPRLVFNVPAGALVDRWDRKRTMIVCDVGRAIALASIVASLGLGEASTVQLSLVAFVEGTLSSFFGLSAIASLPRIVPPDRLSVAVSRNEAVRFGAQMVGPSLGGLLFSLSRSAPFLADAISYTASVLSLLLVRTEFQEERAPVARDLTAEFKAGLAWVWYWPFMRFSLLLIAGTNLLLTANWLAVIVLARQLHASSAAIGVIFSLLGVGGLLGSILAGRMQRHMSAWHIVLGVTWMWSILLPCYALTPHPLLLGALNVPVGIGGASLNVVLMTHLQMQTPDDLQGRAMSATFLIAWVAIPLGSMLAGFLVQTLGPAATIMVLAAAMATLSCAATVTPALRNPTPIARAQYASSPTTRHGMRE